MFSGSIPALVTPFATARSMRRRSAGWSTGRSRTARSALVPCGTTGEAPTLSNEEHHRVIEVCVDQAAGRVPVIAGCGSNDTMNALLHMNFAEEGRGADAALLGRALLQPAEPGRLLAHFSYLAEHTVDLPIVLYNVPGRTVTDIKPETVSNSPPLP
jgi:4-hydroxy-tetrahydrodipicolinate synthase